MSQVVGEMCTSHPSLCVFQSARWHFSPQYVTSLHLEHCLSLSGALPQR
jgi:hypothetical protein